MEIINKELTSEILEYILQLEKEGRFDRFCKFCQEHFMPQLKIGRRLPDIYAPPHKPSTHCESGKKPHCTCDTCF